MRKKYFTLILLGSLLIGCGSNKDIDNKKTSEPDNIKDTLETNLTNSPLEDENSVNTKDFNDYITVDYKPAKVTSIDDNHPDYSGWYINNYEQCEPYEYLHLSKRDDGTYSCSIWAYRAFDLGGTAKILSDNVLSFEGETEFEGNGTIEINKESATIKISDIVSDDEDYELTFHTAIPEPDLSKYLGEYTYTDGAGNKTVFTVNNDTYPTITITKDCEEETIFEHLYLYTDQISVEYYTDNNGDSRELLIAKHDPYYYGIDDNLEGKILYNDDYPRYLIIDNSGKQSKIYYKTMKPEVLH